MRLIVLNALNDPTLEPVRKRNPGKMVRRPHIAGRPLAAGHRRILDHDALSESVFDSLIYFQSIGIVRVFQMGKGGEANLLELKNLLYPPRPDEDMPVLEPMSEEDMVENARLLIHSWDEDQARKALARHEGEMGWWIDTEGGRVFIKASEEEIDFLYPKTPAASGEDEKEPEDAEPFEFVAEEGDVGVTENGEEIPIPEGATVTEVAEVAEADEGGDQPELSLEDIAPEAAEPMDLEEVLDEDEEEEDEDSVETFSVPDDFEARLNVPRVVTNKELREMLAVLGGKGAGKTKKKLIREIMSGMADEDVDPVAANKVLEMLAAAEAE